MTSEGNSALLPAYVDRRPPLLLPLLVFLFVLYNKSLIIVQLRICYFCHVPWSQKNIFLLYRVDWTLPPGDSISSNPAFETQHLGDGVTREEIETVSRA